jgi:hypothetical protein
MIRLVLPNRPVLLGVSRSSRLRKETDPVFETLVFIYNAKRWTKSGNEVFPVLNLLVYGSMLVISLYNIIATIQLEIVVIYDSG